MTRTARRFVGVVLIALVAVAFMATPASADPPSSPDQPGVDSTLLPSVQPTDDPNTQTIPDVQSSDSSPGFFDIGGQVRKAIDDWFSGLVTSAINPVLDLIGKTLLSAPDVTSQGEVQRIWFVSLAIANTVFVLFALAGGIVVMTHDTLQTRYSVKEIAPRLVFAVVAANASLLICSQAINLSNALARSFLGDGLDPATATGGLGRVIVLGAGTGGFLVLLALAATTMCLVLACLFIARAAIVVLLAVAGPVALACHALPQTEGIAILWWRSVVACLGIQIAQALVLITAVRVFFTSSGNGVFGLSVGDGLVSLLVSLSLFWIMLRIPTWAGRMVFGPRGGPIKSATNTVRFVAKTAWVSSL